MSDDQNVGYRRPPVRTRFKPGASGNPSGRPKRRPTFRSVLMDELAAPVPTQPAVSKLQALGQNAGRGGDRRECAGPGFARGRNCANWRAR